MIRFAGTSPSTKASAGIFFSFNKKNYFELNVVGSQIKARFWIDMKPPARSPDATTTFSRFN